MVKKQGKIKMTTAIFIKDAKGVFQKVSTLAGGARINVEGKHECGNVVNGMHVSHIERGLLRQNPTLKSTDVMALVFRESTSGIGFGNVGSKGMRLSNAILFEHAQRQVSRPLRYVTPKRGGGFGA